MTQFQNQPPFGQPSPWGQPQQQPPQQSAPQQPPQQQGGYAPQGFAPQGFAQPMGRAPQPQAAAVTANDLAGVFTNMASAKASINATYVQEGSYWLRLDRVKFFNNRKRIFCMAIEMTCIGVLAQGPKSHRIGDAVTHMLTADKDRFLGDVKAFLGAIMGVPPDSITEQEALPALMANAKQEGTNLVSNTFSGMVVVVTANMITTQKGQPFTRVTYQREVSAAELLASLPGNIKETYFPNSFLEKIAAAEAQQAQAGAPNAFAPPPPVQQPQQQWQPQAGYVPPVQTAYNPNPPGHAPAPGAAVATQPQMQPTQWQQQPAPVPMGQPPQAPWSQPPQGQFPPR